MPANEALVKIVFAALTSDEAVLEKATALLQEELGDIDYTSRAYPFDYTNYYEGEMGTGLSRYFVSFKEPRPPEMLAFLKNFSKDIEEKFSNDGKRAINLDPGYVDYSKFVLASGKYGGHKIGVGPGVYADMLLRYEKGKWHAFPWTFPDFESGMYDKDLSKIRGLLKKQLKEE